MSGNHKYLKLFFLGGMLFLLSCKTIRQEVIQHNYFNGSFFYNDSIKVSIDFLGSMKFGDAAKINKNKLRKSLRNFKEIPIDNILIYCSPEREKRFNMYFFYEIVNNPIDTLTHENLVSVNGKNRTAVYEKQKGNKKIICAVQSFTNENDALDRAKQFIKKVSIDSLIGHGISYTKIIKNYISINNNTLQAIEKIKTAPIKNPQDKMLGAQFIKTLNSFISNNREYDSLIFNYEKKRKAQFSKKVENILLSPETKKNSDVFGAIDDLAQKNQVIILNEDHYYPKHRIFAMEILEILKKNGYKYLSLEGFSKDSINPLIPNTNNGFYVREPYFAHFIRIANALGFIIQGHENEDKNMDREAGQANNIIKILEKDSLAKIFIYVGQSHLEEESEKKRWMASYFKEYSKINPLTINQATYFADANESLILFPRTVLNDTVLKSSADYFLINNIKADLKKVYEQKIFKDILLNNKDFKEFKNKKLLADIYEYEEYNKNKQAIPLISEIVTPIGKTIKLNLPVGKFFIAIKSEQDKRFVFKEVEVK